jgi:hypothetical protein
MIYDLVIVGSGPSGLSLAQKLCKTGKKILIIDRESSIGGCHRVRRVKTKGEDIFTHHGPVVYSDTYVVFRKLLKEMGVDFYDIFAKYNFSISEIGGETIFSTLSFYEILELVEAFLFLTVDDSFGKNVVLYDYIKNFSKESKEMIDRLCKITDGGGYEKFTLHEFLQLFNQQFFHSLYQPKFPNDKVLFKLWKEYLEKNNVEFLLNSTIEKINIEGDEIDYITTNNGTIHSKKIVLAVPPNNLLDIITKNDIPHSLGDLEKFSEDTEYIEYISITFHWDKKLNLKKVYGFPRSEWGVIFIVLSDYMDLDQNSSKTVMSTAVTLTERISSNNNKTANECTEKELIDEVFHQLKISFGDLEDPSLVLLSPGVTYSDKEKKWDYKDESFINSAKNDYLPFECGKIKNLYNLGTHNGKSLYNFTSLESAVSNGVYLSDVLYPELMTDNKQMITKSTSVVEVLRMIVLLIVLIFCLIY